MAVLNSERKKIMDIPAKAGLHRISARLISKVFGSMLVGVLFCSAARSQDVSVNVNIVPIGLACALSASTDNGVTFAPISPCLTVSNGGQYIVRIVVSNIGALPLAPVTLSDAAGFSKCFASPLNLGSLAVGASTTVDCTNACTGGGSNY